MIFLSIILLSPVILIYVQIKFLPYQDVDITWLHRIIVLSDIILLWWLWPRIAAPNKKWLEWLSGPRQPSTVIRSRRRSFISNPLHLVSVALMLAITLIAIFFILVIADFPGGTVSVLLPKWDLMRNDPLLDRKYNLSGHVIVSKEPSSEVLSAYYITSCKSGTYGSNSCDESAIEIGSPSWCKHVKSVQLENRNMRSADLSNAILCGAGFKNANLYAANISEANLRGAQLSDADLRGARLSRTDLRNIQFFKLLLWGWFSSTPPDLRYTNLSMSNLNGTNLSKTPLSGADLSRAKFLGANLSKSELHGVDLTNARLRGVDLSGAILSGANLSRADLRGANLSGAKLHGADLLETDLRGADLRETELVGAQLIETKLDLTDLRNIDFLNQSDMDIIKKYKKLIILLSKQRH